MKNQNEKSDNLTGKIGGGMVLVIIGGLWLLAKMNLFFFPSWVFSFPVFLVALGIFLGARHSFQKPVWLILVIIGGVLLLDNHLLYDINLKRYMWPIVIIGLGIWLIAKPKKRSQWEHQVGPGTSPRPEDAPGYYTDPVNGAYPGGYTDYTGDEAYTANGYDGAQSYMAGGPEDRIETVAVLGGIKKNVISKNFKGGEVVSIFGGTELNLMQADIQHPVVLEAVQVFGGTTLIVPPHWQIKSDEMVAILGGIDDKRPAYQQSYDPNKILILKGTTLFGGLNIKSY